MIGQTPHRRGRSIGALVAALGVLVVFAAPSALAAETPGIDVQLPAQGTFSISGRILTAQGAPVGGAMVVVDRADGESVGVLNVLSEANGRFERNVAADTYRIRVNADPSSGLRSGFYRKGAPGNFTATRSRASLVTVGADVTGIVVRLPAGLTLSGRLLTAGGSPIAGAEVSASSKPGYLVKTSRTGRFKLRGLSPGRMVLEIRGGGNFQGGWYRATGASHFTPNRSSATTLNVTTSRSGLEVRVPRGFRIEGTINGLRGPVAIALVEAGRAGALGPVVAGTDGRGRYVLRGLSPGRYNVQIGAVAADGASGFYAAAAPGNWSGTRAGASTITVGPSRTKVDVTLPTTVSVSGTILNAENGDPVVGATVHAGGEFGNTDGSGHFTISGLAPAPTTIRVQAPIGAPHQDGWYSNTAVGGWRVSEQDATTLDLTGDRAGIEMELPLGHTISGRVTDSFGNPVDGASVSDEGYSRSAITDADGRYAIVGLSIGLYRIRVSANNALGLARGWYSASAAGGYSKVRSGATKVAVGP